MEFRGKRLLALAGQLDAADENAGHRERQYLFVRSAGPRTLLEIVNGTLMARFEVQGISDQLCALVPKESIRGRIKAGDDVSIDRDGASFFISEPFRLQIDEGKGETCPIEGGFPELKELDDFPATGGVSFEVDAMLAALNLAKKLQVTNVTLRFPRGRTTRECLWLEGFVDEDRLRVRVRRTDKVLGNHEDPES